MLVSRKLRTLSKLAIIATVLAELNDPATSQPHPPSQISEAARPSGL